MFLFCPNRNGSIFGWKKLFQTLNCSFNTLTSAKIDVENFDRKQLELLTERCILVDENDKVIGSDSKKSCHLMENINKGLLHRAFSVMIFNTKNEFLLTQRSEKKITFPNYYTNTCCSHPLYTENELEEKDAIGVKRAAIRRLNLELGINPSEIELSDLKFMTKFLYKATSNGIWGEHEIDYALILHKDVNIDPDLNEVKFADYISKDDLLPFLQSEAKKGHLTTPWFKLIMDHFFFVWWNNLDQLDQFAQPNKLHKLS